MCIGEHQMAKDPCGLRPPLVSLLDPEEIDVPVEILLEVRGLHAHIALHEAPYPGTQAVDHLHALEIVRILGVGLECDVGPFHGPDEGAVGALLVVDDRCPLGYVALQGLPDPLPARLPVPAHDRDGVLVHVDRYGYAYEVARQPAHHVVSGSVLQGRVLDVHLVYPAPVAQHYALLVGAERGHHPVPPFEGRLVGDAACLGGEVELGVVAHEPDELRPGRKILLGPLEDGAGERRISPAASGAHPAPPSGGGGRIAAVVLVVAPGASGVGLPGAGCLVERPEADLLAAPSRGDSGGELGEPCGRKLLHHAAVGVLAARHDHSSCPPAGPSVQDVAKHEGGWARWRFRVWRCNHTIRRGRRPGHSGRLYPHSG